MRKNFHSKTVSELPPTSPRKPLPTLPTNHLTKSNNSKALPSPRIQTTQSFIAISADEEELISLLSIEGTKVFVIGLWEESTPLLSNNTNSTPLLSNKDTNKKVPPPLPPKSSSSTTTTTPNNRRLSKITFDTTCFISEDGKALVCESELSSGPLGMQKRSNIILFSEVEKIVPYYQSETLILNVSDSKQTNISSPRQSTNSNPYQITTQDARDCTSFFERYFVSGYDNNEKVFQESLLPFKLQLFILKRKNHKKTLGFFLSGLFFIYSLFSLP